MSEPVKYLSVVSKIVQIYQIQLLTMFKKITAQISPPPADLLLFKNKFDRQIKKIRQIQDDKSIVDDKISDVCQPMTDFLASILRVKNTSHSQRYAIRSNLRTQDTQRMRLTGGLKKNVPQQAEPINQSAEIDQIIKSYKIQQQIGPRMRMKWKSFGSGQIEQKVEQHKKISRLTIGDNNIDLLSYTIPQIQNSIKRLSLQSGYSKQRSPQKIFEAYRTVDTRSNNRKKFVPRLI